MGEPLDVAVDIAADDGIEPENALARTEAVRAAVSRFLELAPAQRSCVILKDVLDYSLDEIAAMLELSAKRRCTEDARGCATFQSVWSRRASARDLASGRALRHAVQCPRLGWRSRDACR